MIKEREVVASQNRLLKRLAGVKVANYFRGSCSCLGPVRTEIRHTATWQRVEQAMKRGRREVSSSEWDKDVDFIVAACSARDKVKTVSESV